MKPFFVNVWRWRLVVVAGLMMVGYGPRATFGAALYPQASVVDDVTPRMPLPGDHTLHILSPNLLELVLINTKAPGVAQVDSWNWVDANGKFIPPDTARIRVTVNGQPFAIAGVGFKRRPLDAPLANYDLRIANYLDLQVYGSANLLLDAGIADGQAVRVVNDGTLWPTNWEFAAVADPRAYSPAVHVNQEGYLPGLPKKALVGYYLGDLGELPLRFPSFSLVAAASGRTVFSGALTPRRDVGYTYSPTPYQAVYEADFSSVDRPGEYYLVVPGLGASLPFRIDQGVALAFARTYALGIYEQRSGVAVSLPFTRFTHGADHTAPALVPTNAAAPFAFTWTTVSNYAVNVNPDNPRQTAPLLTGPGRQLFPFVNAGPVEVAGGHFEAGDYNRVTWNGAQVVHVLMFAVDSLPGLARLDNLGLPESGDGVSDVMEEAKWEADFLLKMQDADGGFYYSVYPQYREYEQNVLPENGDPQVVWPKNTATTAAAVAALAQCASSPLFRQTWPRTANAYLAAALQGWQFLTNALARHGPTGAYQHLQQFGDTFADRDELAWAACELFLATGDPQYEQQLFAWFPDPTDFATFRWGWWRMFQCYGNAVRDYAWAARSGRLAPSQLDATYLAKCAATITNCGNDTLQWSQDNAYGSSFPDLNKAYRGGGWYFSPEQAFDLVVAYQVSPNPAYLDAILRNLNYEGGCNPVNVTYVTGLGWKRQRNVVDQYSLNARHVLPKDGVPVSNIQPGFYPTWTYGYALEPLTYPSDDAATAPYPYYDRWCDDCNVSTEASTTDTTRSLVTAAWLAARTPLAAQTWTDVVGQIRFVHPPAAGQPVVAFLLAPGMDLSRAERVTWEGQGASPAYVPPEAPFTFTPTNYSTAWVEAEAQWPDGRRVFAVTNLSSVGLPPVLAHETTPPVAVGDSTDDGGFTATRSGDSPSVRPPGASPRAMPEETTRFAPVPSHVEPAPDSLHVGVTNRPVSSEAKRRAAQTRE